MRIFEYEKDMNSYRVCMGLARHARSRATKARKLKEAGDIRRSMLRHHFVKEWAPKLQALYEEQGAAPYESGRLGLEHAYRLADLGDSGHADALLYGLI